jgi:hypothetical protein
MIRITGLHCREENHHVGPGQMTVPAQRGTSNANYCSKGIFFRFFSFICTLFNTASSAAPCIVGRGIRTKTCCDFGIYMPCQAL